MGGIRGKGRWDRDIWSSGHRVIWDQLGMTAHKPFKIIVGMSRGFQIIEVAGKSEGKYRESYREGMDPSLRFGIAEKGRIAEKAIFGKDR